MSDPETGQGAAALGLPDAGGAGGAEGVELQTEPRSPETEGEPAEPGRGNVVWLEEDNKETLVVLRYVWVWTVIYSVAVTQQPCVKC